MVLLPPTACGHPHIWAAQYRALQAPIKHSLGKVAVNPGCGHGRGAQGYGKKIKSIQQFKASPRHFFDIFYPLSFD